MERFTVNIKRINWIDKDGSEAEVLFEINGKQFWAFCHPCDFAEDEVADVCLSFIEEEIPEAAFWDENKERKREIISSGNKRSVYQCYGQLKSIHPIMIDCGAITISFGDWINDESAVGSYVYFVMSRFDIARTPKQGG